VTKYIKLLADLEDQNGITTRGVAPTEPRAGVFLVHLRSALLVTSAARICLPREELLKQQDGQLIISLKDPSGRTDVVLWNTPKKDKYNVKSVWDALYSVKPHGLPNTSRPDMWINPLYVVDPSAAHPHSRAHQRGPRYEEVADLASFWWWGGRVSAGVPCALSSVTGAGANIAYWGAPLGMATWTLKLLGWLSDQPHDAHNSTAQSVVAKHLSEGSEDQQRRAVRMLAAALCDVLREWNAGGLDAAAACSERDEMLALDAAFCELLTSLGERGAAAVRDLIAPRRRARCAEHRGLWQGWSLWWSLDEEGAEMGACWRLPFLAYLSEALWLDVVCERFERELYHRPALARGVVHDNLLPMLARRVEVRDAQIIDRDGGAVVAHMAPSINAALALSLAQPGALDVFGRVHAHRLINHLVRAVHEQKEAGVTDFRALDFEGGFSGLRDVIGYTLSKNDELEQLLNAGAGLQFVVPDGQGAGLWTWRATRAARGRKASLRIVTGDPLLPNFNQVYKGTTFEPRLARRLIPVLDHEPRLDLLNSRHQGPALTLVLLMLVELRDNAGELATKGAIRTTAARWRDLAERAGLPAGLVNDILEAWSSSNSGAVQFIERCGAEWTLAEPHALARDFIIEGGQRELIGGQNGRRAKKTKQAKGR
jgi:hypothetical protein